jgi:hypothetical protein
MTQHFTKNTVEASFYCNKCGHTTMHRIDNGRKGPCLECIKLLDDKHNAKDPQADAHRIQQSKLFE